jgi:hypothetical protein
MPTFFVREISLVLAFIVITSWNMSSNSHSKLLRVNHQTGEEQFPRHLFP